MECTLPAKGCLMLPRIATLVAILVFAIAAKSSSDSGSPHDPLLQKFTATSPYFEVCTHKYNNLLLSISNFGLFGAQRGAWQDCETGRPAPSAEFPPGSGFEYLYVAALWIGGIVDDDTLVSVAYDGWGYAQREMLPCNSAALCSMERRSNRPGDPFYHEDARADLEFHAIFSDTVINPSYNGVDWDGRTHVPLGLEIMQTSYCWSVSYASDFILIDYAIRNVGNSPIEEVYVGLYVDGDVEHVSNDSEGHKDDICGFRQTMPSRLVYDYLDTINLAWIADNDGDPDPLTGEFDNYSSPTSITGVRVLRAPSQYAKISFNWWNSNTNAELDWGPMREATYRSFGTGGLGTPEGDRNKYYILSNGDHDYDQIFAAVDMSDQGWLPPSPSLGMVAAQGQDTRFVLSSGPYTINPGDTLFFTIGYIAGENLHRYAGNFEHNMSMAYDPSAFYDDLDFRDIGENSVWAYWVYDNPGYDTDGDGYRGQVIASEDSATGEIDSVFISGDTIPDFRAAAPPPPPVLRFSSEIEKVKLRWNGFDSETFVDPFLSVVDFEGYIVYYGRDSVDHLLSRIVTHDFIDYIPQVWDDERQSHVPVDLPLRIGRLRELYGYDFDPELYICGEGNLLDYKGTDVCLKPADWNQSIPSWDDPSLIDGHVGFRKTYADEIAAGLVTSDVDSTNPGLWIRDIDPRTGDLVLFHKYYEYEFEMDGLLESVPWYFSVTAFDFGDFEHGLPPQESFRLANSVEVWPINDASEVLRKNLKVQVYPNPYIADGRYVTEGYEDRKRTGYFDHERRIHFVNLPPYCTIKIYTLDGDFVRELPHPGRHSDTDSKLEWNMRSRNNELVASGIYIFAVESDWGNQIGKLVIIR